MEPARGGKGPVDQLVRNAVVQGIKEADVFTGMRDLVTNPFERARRTGEIGPVIDHRDLTGSRLMILDPMLLEQVHLVLQTAPCREYNRCRLDRTPRCCWFSAS